MEYADFKSWPGISSCGVFARHGFPSDLLIPVLVSMATLFSARSPTFTHGEQRLWRDVEGCAFEKLYFFFFLSLFPICVEISFHECVCVCVCVRVCVCACTLVTVRTVFGEISTVTPASIWITSRAYWIDYWMAMTTGYDLDLEVWWWPCQAVIHSILLHHKWLNRLEDKVWLL